MHTIERELIKVTAFKARKFSDRQDYLKSILNAVSKLTDDDFNNLTDATAGWANAAVEAHNIKGRDLPDFDEVIPEDEDSEAEETAEAEDDAEGVTEDPDDEATEDEPDEEASEDELPQDQEADEEPEPEEKPKRNKKKPPAAKKAEASTTGTAVRKSTSKLNRGSDEDVVFDKWGAMEGSKNSQALAMFEQGATTKEVKDELGGTYYNILKKMVQNGHKLNKEGAVITLVHADSNKPAPKKKK